MDAVLAAFLGLLFSLIFEVAYVHCLSYFKPFHVSPNFEKRIENNLVLLASSYNIFS
jgi:hypothetical protein